jgi:hypothetical protein
MNKRLNYNENEHIGNITNIKKCEILDLSEYVRTLFQTQLRKIKLQVADIVSFTSGTIGRPTIWESLLKTAANFLIHDFPSLLQEVAACGKKRANVLLKQISHHSPS